MCGPIRVVRWLALTVGMGDVTSYIQGLINSGDITAYDDTGTLNLDYNTTNAGKTTLSASP